MYVLRYVSMLFLWGEVGVEVDERNVYEGEGIGEDFGGVFVEGK